MDTLDGTAWDVIIAGTGLQPALLALALSRSGKKILHVDSNDYYGGAEAALSISEAEAWVQRLQQDSKLSSPFSNASLAIPPETTDQPRLGPPRQYSLSLAPTLLYTRSSLLSSIVSSRVHEQLEFLAVGSWFVFQSNAPDSAAAPFQPPSKLLRVPNSREDIFSDTSLSIRAKGALVKFLRFVAVHNDEDKKLIWEPYKDKAFADFLVDQFKIQPEFHAPLLALCMSLQPSGQVTTGQALESIFRHLTSMGVFGAGFSAVLPKYGGLSEIVQVACRAAAVTGALYVLNRGIVSIKSAEPGEGATENISAESLLVVLQGGDKVSAHHMFGTSDQFPQQMLDPTSDTTSRVSRSITIVGSKLASLFPPSTGGSPAPSAAVIVFASGSLHDDQGRPTIYPVHALVHSGDTGECPATQCVIYASTTTSVVASAVLKLAVQRLLSSIDEQPLPPILWSMTYEATATSREPSLSASPASRAWILSSGPSLPVFDDKVLDSVKAAWRIATDSAFADEHFLSFSDRSAEDVVGADDVVGP